MIGSTREMLEKIGGRLSDSLLLEANPPRCRVIFNAASQQLANLQVTDLPAVGYLWAGYVPDSPPEQGPHIRSTGQMLFLVLIYAASGADPTDPGPAYDIMDAVEEALVDFEVRWNNDTEGANLYLVEQRGEEVIGMTVVVSAVFGATVTKVAA